MTPKFAAILLLVCASLAAASDGLVNGPEGDCGISALQPRLISHFVDRGAITKVKPVYPLAAKAKSLAGMVSVRVLINKQGLVERTCPVYASSEPRPDRSLVVAAEAAALQWTFRPNFGLEPSDGIRFSYAQDVLVFKFVPEEPTRDSAKHD